ncbi:uncharacterized protein J7T54_003131 [Emericellopsis cladophorae]|uniref:Uncharacterized protein n=1 Tax=Emericellopsis cladophorae TaxID=2686198 RepID=A0A9P9Y115_9HYPO|nr:uncharacterized protein J7T54_003131 [Emericellopsis cladophorae]KAI6780989.1 hypothetical protein J7T54_003131 [Emericellopsis cladophorae]
MDNGRSQGPSVLDDTDTGVSENSNPNANARNRLPARHYHTLYDAVAGKVRAPDSEQEATMIKHSLADSPVSPAELLFRRLNAPIRYAEYDIYASHTRDFPDYGNAALPDSDLLKAIHAYASGYYARNAGPEEARVWDEKSMDETALLAFGILMEEASRETLGRKGDLVFTEAEKDEEGQGDVRADGAGDEPRAKKKRKTSDSTTTEMVDRTRDD